jgi:putative FmdB family regulatory protein
VPTYQYACTECEHGFETVQSFSDPSLTECPVCSGRLRKVFGAVGIVFKGSGFYRTDSRDAKRKGADAAATSDGKSDSKSDTKSDSKVDAKSDTAKPAAKSDGGGSSSTPAASSSKPSGSAAGKGSSTAGSAA